MGRIALYRDPARGKYEWSNGFKTKIYKGAYPNLFMEYASFDDVFEDAKYSKQPFYYYLIHLMEHKFFFSPGDIEIPKKVLGDIKRGTCKILCANILEGFRYDKYYDPFIDGVQAKYDILKDAHFVILSANLAKHDRFSTIYHNGWETMAIYCYSQEWLQRGVDNIEREKEYKYICLNRRPHAHRLAMFLELYDKTSGGILTQWPDSGGPTMVHDSSVKARLLYKDTAHLFDKYPLDHLLPVKFEGDVNADIENPVSEHGEQADKYYNSYCHFVSETFFDDPGIFFSEKIFKPILYMQPFVLICQPGAVQALRDMDYDVFDDWIDHSYDNEPDPEKRFKMVFEQMRRVAETPLETLHEINKGFKYRYIQNMANLYARTKESTPKLVIDLQDAFYGR